MSAATSAKSLAAAERLVDRYNAERERIERLETQLYELRSKNRRTYDAMFDALPDNCAISLDPHGPSKVVQY